MGPLAVFRCLSQGRFSQPVWQAVFWQAGYVDGSRHHAAQMIRREGVAVTVTRIVHCRA